MNFWRHPRHTRILPAMKASVKGELLVGLAVLVQGISEGEAEGRVLHWVMYSLLVALPEGRERV